MGYNVGTCSIIILQLRTRPRRKAHKVDDQGIIKLEDEEENTRRDHNVGS